MTSFNEAYLNNQVSTVHFSHKRDAQGVFTVHSLEHPVHAMGKSLDNAIHNLQQNIKFHLQYKL